MIKGALRRVGWGGLVVGLLAAGTYMAARHGGAGHLHMHDVEHQVLAEGAELVQARLYRGTAANAGQLVVIYVDPSTVGLEVVLNANKKRLVALAPKAGLVMNAGYFTPEYRPTGLLVSNGKVLSPFVSTGGPAGSGVLLVEAGKVQLLRREDVGTRRFDGADVAIQAGPRLLEPDGARGIRSDDGQHANRSFIGADERGWLVLGVVHRGDSGLGGGPSLFELQRVLLQLKPHAPAVVFALNLDGGPSTGLHLRAKTTLNLPESGTVYSALAVRASWP